MLHVDCVRWGQTPEDLRRLATGALHPRTRERFLALYEITQASCATRVAPHTHRHPQTVMEWVHTYNARGPESLTYRRTGGRPPFARTSKPLLAASSAPPGAPPPPPYSRCRSPAPMDAAAPGRLGARALWPALLSRDDPGRSAPSGPVLEEGQDAARSGRFRKAASLRRAGARPAGRCPTRPLPAGIHQDADLGYGWSPRGQRFWVTSHSPGLSAKLSFYGLYLYNHGAVRLWPYPRANGAHTIEALRRLRAEWLDGPLIVLWDGAPYHRATCVRDAAAALGIEIVPLPGYSPDFMPVEALWRWLREDVTYHYCHPTADDLRRRVSKFQATINQDPYAVADRLVVKDHLDPEEEKLRF